MRYLIISDVHANIAAFEAVLEDADSYDLVIFLGDLVGYGPDPNECVDRMRDLPELIAIMGNHDAAVLNQLSTEAFNAEARRTVTWTQDNLTPENLDYLKELPSKALVIDDITLAHGSPRQPIWEYVLNAQTATENFFFFETSYCFVGHTHLPSIFRMGDGRLQADLFIPIENSQFELRPRLILNPGSVGQPRDRDPRAAYAIYDIEKKLMEFRRAEYDVSAVQQRMRDAGLPERHINRLESGW
ncbi:MAG: metallophosphoesterase family protein [Anaerolineales bacterium]|nr:metallophosphoesterase family protein [Chloroflexota bacterium]MBL6979701.1 metallophosphoesterase family protein [Anaerolineales bacterium]